MSCVKLRKARYAWNAQVIAWVTNCRGGELHGLHTSTRKTKEAKIRISMQVTCLCLSQLSLISAMTCIVCAKMITIKISCGMRSDLFVFQTGNFVGRCNLGQTQVKQDLNFYQRGLTLIVNGRSVSFRLHIIMHMLSEPENFTIVSFQNFWDRWPSSFNIEDLPMMESILWPFGEYLFITR